jgi:hypothetical protein
LRNEGEGIDLEVNSIQSLYPKDRVGGVIEWVNTGLLKEISRFLNPIDQFDCRQRNRLESQRANFGSHWFAPIRSCGLRDSFLFRW